MNTNIANSLKKIMFVAFAATLFIANPLTTRANGENPESQLNVQYAGATDKGLLFNVKFENPTAQKFTLIIKNDQGDILYRGAFSGSHFSKNILFLKDDEVLNPTFIVRTADNQELKHSLEVKRTVVEDVVVTKL